MICLKMAQDSSNFVTDEVPPKFYMKYDTIYTSSRSFTIFSA